MFNKREAHKEQGIGGDGQDPRPASHSSLTAGNQSPARTEPAVIGPSIHIEGSLKGEEDLVIDGSVKGTVTLKNHALIIGDKGKVTADLYAKTIHVKGSMQGDLYASEKVSIGSTATVKGNIASPRVSLEDGARFKGSIEMDPEAEVLKTAFRNQQTPAVQAVPSAVDSGQPAADAKLATKSGGSAA